MSSYCDSKSLDPVRDAYTIVEPHNNAQLDLVYVKRDYRSDSLEFITPIGI